MKASELRIGNYVFLLNEIISTQSHDIGNIQEQEGSDKYSYRPILLTKEWLVKLGFKWSDKYCLWSIKEPFYFPLRSDFSLVIFRRGIKIKPDYVHELQNLYFALTGEELTIKE